MEKTKTKKKVSKKSKTSWRKNTDVKDVEEFLEEVRRDERTGGSARVKTDAELFFVHKKADVKDKPPAGRKHRVDVPKQRKRNAALAEEARQKSAAAARKSAAPQEKKSSTCPIVDLWATPSEAKPSKIARQKAAAPAVEVPLPGTSYNPAYNEHQNLLRKATVVEVEKLRKREKLNRFASSMPAMNQFEREKTWVEEMSVGLQLPGAEAEEDGSDEDLESDDSCRGDEEAPAAPKVVRADYRKSAKQRRKEKEQRETERKARLTKEARLRENEVYRLRSIKKEISREASSQQQVPKAAQEKNSQLGPFKFEEPDMEIQLSDELSGSLRRLKPEGNLFKDRFHSLQRRKMIEPRRPVIPHRKYRVKQYTKEAFK